VIAGLYLAERRRAHPDMETGATEATGRTSV
jgi:hypothetical protein